MHEVTERSATAADYDSLPYESTPFAETHPAHLAALGRLFGLDCAAPQRCRVLELGCASGGNLIPLAWHLRQSQFVGVDLSPAQVEAGRALSHELGLDNLQLHAADILDFEPAGGPFDYVIAHGLYSWVPQAVRERILKLCAGHLAPHGIAYISYNTLPGWRMRGMLRDMLLYHIGDERRPQQRLERAGELFDLLESGLSGLDAHSARS